MINNDFNRLVLIGNGFDLAHGLKTSYRDFIDWYFCNSFDKFCSNGQEYYSDLLIEIKSKFFGTSTIFKEKPKTCQEVINLLGINDNQSLNYKSNFFEKIIKLHQQSKWVDIEIFYFRELKELFLNSKNTEEIKRLNEDFNVLIIRLAEYIKIINDNISTSNKLPIEESRSNLKDVIAYNNGPQIVKFLNFNYTDTLSIQYSVNRDEIIHIHGSVKEVEQNPIIFGYGDESDPEYQKIEDSGDNMYLRHIKSFGYFQTSNYHKLLSFIDSGPFSVHIVGHSCGLSDRVLLNQIFEHQNCNNIDVFYHKLKDGTDNFKELTQEISRHFRSQNKAIMRRRLKYKDSKNFIPQN